MTVEWGKLAPQIGRGVVPAFVDGALDEVTVRAIGPAKGAPLGHVATAIAALGKLPAAGSLRALHVLKTTRKNRRGDGAWHPDHTHGKTLAALTTALPRWPLLRAVSLDDYDVDLDLHDEAVALAFWEAAAHLEQLTLRARTFLSATHPSFVRWPPALRTLRVEAQEGHRLVFDRLSVPHAELRGLDVWLPGLDLLVGASAAVRATHAPGPRGADDRDVVAAWLAAAHERFPRLEHLGLLLCDDARLIELVAASPIAARLRSLSLAGGRVTAEGLGALAKTARALEALDLEECELDAACVAAARAIVPGARVRSGVPSPRGLGPFVRLPYQLAVESSWITRWQRPVRDGDELHSSLVLGPRPRA